MRFFVDDGLKCVSRNPSESEAIFNNVPGYEEKVFESGRNPSESEAIFNQTPLFFPCEWWS